MWVQLTALSLILFYLLIGITLVEALLKCYDIGNFSANSEYGKNRDLILASLPSNISAKGGFLTTSIGQNFNKVYTLAMCRGDSSPYACYECIYRSIHNLVTSCTNQKEALLYARSPCHVHYADRSFYGTLELDPPEVGFNNDDITPAWESLMDSVGEKASNGTSTLKFANGEADFGEYQKIYTRMQCTPDLSHKDCDSCLSLSVSYFKACCHGKKGGYVRRPNCYFRWELHPFYTSNATPPPSPFSPPPPLVSLPPQSANSTNTKEGGGSSSKTIVIIVVPIVILVAVLVILAVAVVLKRIKKKKAGQSNRVESLQFDFNAVKFATENFSNANILGRGGFGSVYKGQLEDGRKVAIKRLSKNSGQGQQEFRTEVILLAKLQHKEFDPVKRLLLNWEKRYKIIEGIARGLLYLHQDSQYRIIHRDLKAASILLDEAMNPKISDFGMAKLFVPDQTRAAISKIVGTFGYMVPECARHGRYSVKSDVYSFGVLVLEIISGKKINSFTNQELGDSLLTYAWRNWNEGTAWEVVDPILWDGSRSEIMGCIHLGLLCVQDNITYRPTMASVVLMLSSYSMSLPLPSRPAFSMHSTGEKEKKPDSVSLFNQSKGQAIEVSANEASISELSPR